MSEPTHTEQDFAATVSQLETIVARLESGELSLEEALTAFEQGVQLTREAQQRLDRAELKVRALSEDHDGHLTVTAFTASADSPSSDGGHNEETPPW